jgi:uncharacterized protein (TIGR01777 family)
MNILITGGTGFIGNALCQKLLQENYNIIVLSRTPELVNPPLNGIQRLSQLDNHLSLDIVINLAGEGIADKRWSDQQQKRIIDSRIETTNQLINYFNFSKLKPKLFISASAIGYYGINKSDTPVDETFSYDNSFSSQLCQQWESVALKAERLGIRTCLLRFGIVIGKNGGALAKMLPAFKVGLGGVIGQGQQWMSWIHLEDLVGVILSCRDNDSLKGPINVTAPYPQTNKQFTQALGKALKRPTLLSIPSIMVKLLMGQMGEELLLSGKKVLPTKLLKVRYPFKYPMLEDALKSVLDDKNK